MFAACSSPLPLIALAATLFLLALWLLRWAIRAQNEEPQDYDRESLWLMLGLAGAAVVSISVFTAYLLSGTPGC